jgi:hypothetical protein
MATTQNDLGLSLWLIPPDSYKPYAALSRLTSTSFPASPNFPESPGFNPHITLTSSIPPPKSGDSLLPSLPLDRFTPPEIEFGELAHGDAYFKFIFLRIKKSASLVALAKLAREKLTGGTFDEGKYDPHISLVYSSEESTEKRVEYVAWKTSMAIGSSQGWTGGKVVLVDTTSRNVAEWKVVEEYSFPESS